MNPILTIIASLILLLCGVFWVIVWCLDALNACADSMRDFYLADPPREQPEAERKSAAERPGQGSIIHHAAVDTAIAE